MKRPAARPGAAPNGQAPIGRTSRFGPLTALGTAARTLWAFLLVRADALAESGAAWGDAGQAPISDGPGAPGGPGGPGFDPAMADIRDIRPPLALPPDRLWLWLLLAGLLLGLAAFLVWKILLPRLVARRRPTPPDETAPSLDPDAVAAAGLNALERADSLDDRDYYFRLTDVLRRHLESVAGLPALRLSVEELAPALATLFPGDPGFSRPPGLAELLAAADACKFGGRRAEPGRRARDLALVREFLAAVSQAGARARDAERQAREAASQADSPGEAP